MSLTIRALLLIWPFLKRALFGDLTVKEVVLANMHLTTVYVCLCVLVYLQLYSVVELSVVKSETRMVVEAVCPDPALNNVEALKHRRKLFGEILK